MDPLDRLALLTRRLRIARSARRRRESRGMEISQLARCRQTADRRLSRTLGTDKFVQGNTGFGR